MDSSAADSFFDVAQVASQIGEEGIEGLWQEVREQWVLDMEVMISEQMLIAGHAHRNPGRINRRLDCYADTYTHPMFDNFVQVAYGWDANWKKDPDKLSFIKRKFPLIVAPVEKPMDRIGWSRAAEPAEKGQGLTLTDCYGNAA